jgi:hypothetical protein
MLVGLPTAQGADTTLTLACKGKQTSGVGARSETATTWLTFSKFRGILLNEKHYASPSRRTHTRNSIRRNGCHIGV